MADVAALASRIMLRTALLLLAWTASASGDHLAAQPVQDDEWRGRAVCVDETGAIDSCGAEGNRYALRSAEGTLHWFMRDDPLAPVFDDVRIREQDVAVRVRSRADGTGELIK